MNIIFVSNSMARPKTLSTLQVALLVVSIVGLSVALTLTLILPQGSGQHHGVKSLIKNPLHFGLNNRQQHLSSQWDHTTGIVPFRERARRTMPNIAHKQHHPAQNQCQ